MRKILTQILGWINEKRERTFRKKENFYRYRRLMLAENTPEVREELREYLAEFQVSEIDFLQNWQRIAIFAATVVIELSLALFVAILFLRLQPKLGVDPLWVLLGSAVVIAVPIDGWVVWSLLDRIDVGIYCRRIQEMEEKIAVGEITARLASKPA